MGEMPGIRLGEGTHSFHALSGHHSPQISGFHQPGSSLDLVSSGFLEGFMMQGWLTTSLAISS